MTITPTDRVTATLDDVRAAVATHEAAIHAAASGGVSAARIARACGTSRTRILGVLGKGPDGGTPVRPRLTPTVYLRGAGVKQPAWDRIEATLWARGWDTTHDRTSAFHLARGGVPVVLVDFTSQLPNGLSRGVITVGRVRARYRDDHEEGTLVDLLTTADAAQAWRDHAPWVDHPVTIVTTEMELPLISGGDIPRPYRLDEDRAEVLDEQAIVRAVAEGLGETIDTEGE